MSEVTSDEQLAINREKDVVFIDVYNLIYRAYHGNPVKLTNSEGIPTSALLTFTKMILKLKNQFHNLEHIVAVFDGGGGNNFRKELDAEYKANRKPMPDDLKIQMPYIKEMLEILGFPMLQAVDVEADDLIGTLAVRAAAKGFNTYIVSCDKDFRQIVTDNLQVLDTMADICYNPAKVMEKMGVYPENVPAWLALVGDGVDNVEGVKGIAKGTAPKLLATYGDLPGLIANKDQVKGKIGENLREAIENGQLLRSLELVILKTDVDVKITRKDITMRPVDDARWLDFCNKMEFKTFKHNPKL
jgi:DNA polymerase-1